MMTTERDLVIIEPVLYERGQLILKRGHCRKRRAGSGQLFKLAICVCNVCALLPEAWEEWR